MIIQRYKRKWIKAALKCAPEPLMLRTHYPEHLENWCWTMEGLCGEGIFYRVEDGYLLTPEFLARWQADQARIEETRVLGDGRVTIFKRAA